MRMPKSKPSADIALRYAPTVTEASPVSTRCSVTRDQFLGYGVADIRRF